MSQAPFISSLMKLEKGWIDYNGHLNMAYYNVLFDRGVDEIWSQIGFGADYLAATGCTTFSAEFHVCYLKELHLGAKVRASFQLLDYDEKRIHFYQELIHEDGWISATGEGMGLHIDQSGPKVTAMPNNVLKNVATLFESHKSLARPERAGRQMGIPHKA